MSTPARTGRVRRSRRGVVHGAAGALAFLGVAGSMALVFTDDPRLLKVAVLAVLWVALGSLFAVVSYRKNSETTTARSRDLRLVYELELEREVHARREHELAVEREVRQGVSVQMRAEATLELDGLRDELKALRENLSVLLSGDLLVERVALRAESTRLRSLTDTARLESGAAVPIGRPHSPDLLEAETVEPQPDETVEPQPDETVEPQPDEPVGPHSPDLLEAEPVEPQSAPEQRAAEPPLTEPGAHSAGRSVSDLIAAYGGADASRRRRRADD